MHMHWKIYAGSSSQHKSFQDSHSFQEAINHQLPEVWRQACKVGCEARDPNHQIGIHIRILIGCFQLISIQNIDIDQSTALFEMTLNQI